MRNLVVIIVVQFVLASGVLAATPVDAVFRTGVGEQSKYLTRLTYGFQEISNNAPAFHAVVTNVWLAGLVPIFAVERNGRIELRRLPARGQENFSEPLFFGLPPAGESAAGLISGAWKCEALRQDRSKAWPDFELAVQGTNVAGRFDQTTEYRFAYITSGSFVSNRLTFRVEYIQQHYELTGMLLTNRFEGTYRQIDGDDRGTWTAWREVASFEVDRMYRAVALYEWRRVTDNARRYELEDVTLDADWERRGEPLCVVWVK